ncbi:RHS repeat-associated core domain-containing protein [Xanthomonas protegens]|uniref:RHS repeat-associated core domain-containing protein n=1 Tax=Xanthomonas protegens TaxID=3380705 RepID=A0ABU9LDG2_9XANT|nr:RHS repeat-associated core domain-containing protein [Xanthomonas sp. NCPPB 1128]
MSNFHRTCAAIRLMALAVLSLLIAFGASAQTVRYIHTDRLGSVVLITDKDRNVVGRNEYEPYGSLLNHPATDSPGYTGHVMDVATGLTYMQQRYYDQGLGRFLSVDQVTPYESNVRNFNRYVYVANNPYLLKDPDGRQWECDGKICHFHGTVGEVVFKDLPEYVLMNMAMDLIGSVANFTNTIQRAHDLIQNSEGDSSGNEGQQGVRELGDLEPTHAPDHPQNDPAIPGLSDEELRNAINNPKNGDAVTVRGNTVLDGNTRINEAKSRGWPDNTLIPVDELPERPDNVDDDPLGPYGDMW